MSTADEYERRMRSLMMLYATAPGPVGGGRPFDSDYDDGYADGAAAAVSDCASRGCMWCKEQRKRAEAGGDAPLG